METEAATTFVKSAAVMALVRYASQTEGKDQLRDQGLQLVGAESADFSQVHDHWMALILLAGSGLRLTLKAFYSSALCRSVLAEVAGTSQESISEHLIPDVMRELCNRIGGCSKRLLGDVGLTVGLSLPLVTRGFDQVFMKTSRAKDTDTDLWYIVTKHGKIVMTVELVRSPADSLDKFTWTIPLKTEAAAADDGELDFL